MLRVTLRNDNATADLRGAIFAMESRDMAQDATKDTTAKLAYEAEALTPLGGAAIATRTAASGGGSNNVIRHANLSNLWQTILSSQILATRADMTHVGVRRIWARIFDPGTTPGEVELRLEWRALGQSRWTQNRIVATPLVGGFALVDLGECRPDAATLGDQRWEWRITARTTGTAGADIEVDKVWPLPTEQYMFVQEPIEIGVPTAFEAFDAFDQSAGSLAGKTAAIGGTWSGAGDADDYTINTTDDCAQRVALSDASGVPRYAILGTSEHSTIACEVDVTSTNPESTGLLFMGCFVRYVDTNNWLAASLYKSGIYLGRNLWHAALWKKVAGVKTLIGGGGAAEVLSETYGTPIAARIGVVALSSGEWQLRANDSIMASGKDSALGAAGALARGKVGLYDECGSATAQTRTFDNIAAWVPELDAVAAAGRGMEIRSDGVFRQDRTDDVWGQVIPEGFLPYAPPSGLEGRAARCCIIPTQGELGELPDSGTNRISATVSYRPAYLYSREAAS